MSSNVSLDRTIYRNFRSRIFASRIWASFIVCVIAISACGARHEARKKKNPPTGPVTDTTPHSELPKGGTALFSPEDAHVSDHASWQLRIEWTQGPTAKDDAESIAYITFADPNLQMPTTIGEIQVKPWMKLHGHGTGNLLPTITPVKDNPTKFQVSELYFLMSGPWELQINATINGIHDYVEVKVEVDP